MHYTNYIRIPPDQANEQVLPTRGSVSSDAGAEKERLLPTNDAEREWAEIRLQRLPPKERIDGPQRLYVNNLFFMSFYFFNVRFLGKLRSYTFQASRSNCCSAG